MAVTNIDELASQLIQQIGSYFERISASASRSIEQFPDAGQSNYLYVLYSASGMPLHAGCVVGEGRGRAPRELQTLTTSGAVASFRTVELGNENLAVQLDRLVRELFHPALPFVEQPTGTSAAAATGGNGRRRGRPAAKATGRRRGRPRKEDAAAGGSNGRRRPGRPRKNAEAGTEATVRRRPGRPRKNAEAGGEAAAPRRRPGRPRKNAEAGGEAAAPRRRPGRPRKNAEEGAAAAETPRRRPGRPRKNAATE